MAEQTSKNAEYEEINSAIREDYQSTTFDQMEEATVSLSQRQIEKMFLGYISLGNVSLAEQLISKLSASDLPLSFGRMSEDPLQQARYAIVSSVTLFCRAAIDSGLPEHLAYRISDSYIQHLDDTKDVDAVYSLFFSSFREYCQVMQNFQLSQCRQEVKACCEYIMLHVHERIRLEDLSRVCNLSPNHVSDLFARELGLRPSEYIRKQKLSYACFILDNFGSPVTEISDLLSFPSPSAFSQQFKTAYGMTPKQYQNRKK